MEKACRGRNIETDRFLIIRSTKPHLIIEIKSPKSALTWIHAIGKVVGNASKGDLYYKGKAYSYSIKSENNVCEITFYDTFSELLLQGLIKRALYKAAFCINCETCEVECPTGALQIIPEATINRDSWTAKSRYLHRRTTNHSIRIRSKCISRSYKKAELIHLPF